ncbi:MAG: relaxase/mobilization nuclease domain-containing protein [Clostridia bacterium]|nr:relaxase/mobilization nuclease domain-containing protein [Clostridia bacterium]
MRRVLEYVMQDKKTLLGGIKLVSGQNCVPESAYQEFMATKHQYGKAKGVFFKQYVQSFSPNCCNSPALIHEIGVEMAKAFDGFEVVVATHIDRDHWHNHFIVNAVNCESGLKIQINEDGLTQLRQRSDEICRQFGLTVLKPYQKPKQRTLNQREYRAALRGNSKKLRLANAIDYAVAHSRTKRQFIDEMAKLGYGVKWIDRYKYITYTTPDGERFRDNRLPEEKYLKSNMEELFAFEYRSIETKKSNSDDNGGDSERADRTDTAHVSDAQAGAIQPSCGTYQLDWVRHCAERGFDIRAAYFAGSERADSENTSTELGGDAEDRLGRDGLYEAFRRGRIVETDGADHGYDRQGNAPDDGGTESARSGTVENQTEMGADWRDIAVDGMYLAADLIAVSRGKDEEDDKSRYIRERGRGRRKKREHRSDNDPKLTM